MVACATAQARKKLVDHDILKISFKIINMLYNEKKNNTNNNFFIDATNIRNINGNDKIGINCKDKNKKGNKISVL